MDVSLQNDPGKATRGVLSVIDNTVDPATGTIKLKATFTNEDRILWPGTFVNVILMLDSRDNAILVPSEAIQAGQNGQFRCFHLRMSYPGSHFPMLQNRVPATY